MINKVFKSIHTADIHFGAMDPKIQYEILMEQMIKPLYYVAFDAFFINGDLFHHKFMSNSDVIMYTLLFIDEVTKLCIKNNATLVILHGTLSHDADQLKLFYRYINSDVDIRIIEYAQFQNIKGHTVLCIPEEYGKGKDYYEHLLYFTCDYDMCVLHGNIKGAIYGMNKADLDSAKNPTFDINNFVRCNGPILCGHVHVKGCYQNHIYYSGSPLRWRFGEEDEKGFLICLHDLTTGYYTVDFQPIVSFRYDTVNLDSMVNLDPKVIINHICSLKDNGIDFLKVRFCNATTSTDAVKQYFCARNDIRIDVQDSGFIETIKENQKASDEFNQYNYLLDTNLSEYDKLAMFVNQRTGEEFITADDLIKILSEAL